MFQFLMDKDFCSRIYMKQLIKKVSVILLVLCMALSSFTAISVSAKSMEKEEINNSRMRVGHSSWIYDQMGMHSSARIGAGSRLGPHKVTDSGEWVWYCLRQKITKGTKYFSIEDVVDPCLEIWGVSVFLKNTWIECTNYFTGTGKNPPENIVRIGTQSNVTMPYAAKDVTFDFYIICKFKNAAAAENHGHRSGNNWVIGNKATITMDSLKKSSNFSYIYGDLSPEHTGTNMAKLYYPDGEQYGKNYDLSKGAATFPSVNLGLQEGLCMGWTETKPIPNVVTKPKYIAGDKIPRAGNYYMVVFTETADRRLRPNYLATSPSDTVVYFIGDSRTQYMKWTLSNYQDKFSQHVLGDDKVHVIAESGQGLCWFETTGLPELKKAMQENNGKNQIVIMNLGVNDAAGVSGPKIYDNANYYVEYMRDAVAKPLKALYNDKVKFYYMSVNPLCSQAVKDDITPGYSITEQNIVNFNKKIFDGLCSGSNKCFTYIDTYNELLMSKGWFPAIADARYDGIHYSDSASLRIYNYCMRKVLNKI